MRYHANANTNINQRQAIQENKQSTYRELASQYCVSVSTISHWKRSEDVYDHSSSPHSINYTLNEYEQQLICGVRQMEWHSVDDITILLEDIVPKSNRTNVYRTLKRASLNTKPKQEKSGTGKFAKYKPGYIHIDVFYLPKLNGEKAYVFVAIDRTTKMLHVEVYPDKSQESSLSFLEECVNFFPFKIHTILTDNGREFTLHGFRNRYGVSKKIHDFTLYSWSMGIDHRTTKVRHPWTNGQVERINGILENKTIKRYQYDSHEAIRQHLKQLEIHWNYYKRHKTLNLKTIPLILKEWYDKDPEIFRVPIDQLPFATL